MVFGAKTNTVKNVNLHEYIYILQLNKYIFVYIPGGHQKQLGPSLLFADVAYWFQLVTFVTTKKLNGVKIVCNYLILTY